MEEEKVTSTPAADAAQSPETEPAEKTAAEAASGTEQQEPAKEKKKRDKKTEKLSQELEALQKQLKEEQDSRLRVLAEYDNYRKRSTKEKDHIYQDAVADTLQKFLPVYDNLERAMQQATADEAYKKGVEMIMSAMTETLQKCGVEPFGAVGDAFDPAMHNAVMHIEDENFAENTIADVFQKGFRMGDKVVRFAMVRVAN